MDRSVRCLALNNCSSTLSSMCTSHLITGIPYMYSKIATQSKSVYMSCYIVIMKRKKEKKRPLAVRLHLVFWLNHKRCSVVTLHLCHLFYPFEHGRKTTK